MLLLPGTPEDPLSRLPALQPVGPVLGGGAKELQSAVKWFVAGSQWEREALRQWVVEDARAEAEEHLVRMPGFCHDDDGDKNDDNAGQVNAEDSAAVRWADDHDGWDIARIAEAHAIVERQRGENSRAVSAFKAQKYDMEAGKFWHRFYRSNGVNFFKDRHYLQTEFPELLQQHAASGGTLLEVGCGVGNALFPLLRANPRLFGFAVDFAPEAVRLVRANPEYGDGERCSAHVCDVARQPLPPCVAQRGVDVCTLLFCLSAMLPERMPVALMHVYNCMKPGATLCFRDYGRYDLAQLRFKNARLQPNLYVRGDATQAYFFALSEVQRLFTLCGFDVVELAYIKRVHETKAAMRDDPLRDGGVMHRVWVHAKCIKPIAPAAAECSRDKPLVQPTPCAHGSVVGNRMRFHSSLHLWAS